MGHRDSLSYLILSCKYTCLEYKEIDHLLPHSLLIFINEKFHVNFYFKTFGLTG